MRCDHTRKVSLNGPKQLPVVTGKSWGSPRIVEWVAKTHLGKLRHELNIGDNLRQCGTTFRIQDAVGRISQPIEGLFEPVVPLESAWVVWIVLLHRVIGVVP